MPHSMKQMLKRLWRRHILNTSLLTPITQSKTNFLGLFLNIPFLTLQSLFSSIASDDCILYGIIYHFASHTYFLSLFQCDTIQGLHDIAFICALSLPVAKIRQHLCFFRGSLVRSKSFRSTEWLSATGCTFACPRIATCIRAGIIWPVEQALSIDSRHSLLCH
jgi:hypothetical protein